MAATSRGLLMPILRVSPHAARERTSSRNSSALAARFKQEPGATLRLVDPVLDQARRRDVAGFIYNIVHLAQAGRELLVVLAELGQHVERLDVVRIVVLDALQARNVPDGAQRVATHFADALG